MPQHTHLTRRTLIALSGSAAATLLKFNYADGAQTKKGAGSTHQIARTPDEILRKLLDGNQRFIKGQTTALGRKPEDFVKLAEQQTPLAVIVGCADSRVPPEILFDQGIGELFVVRVAGNIISGTGAAIKGSIEYAVAELGVPLIMVLGHSNCGAVRSAMKHIHSQDVLPGAINELVNTLKPAVLKVKDQQGDILKNAIKANVEIGMDRLRGLEPILAAQVKAAKVKVVGGVYDLSTGAVSIIS
jgi:carbonic anhydrase